MITSWLRSIYTGRQVYLITQVEYCFTAEGTDKQPAAYSLRGLDAATHYRRNGVLNCGHARVRQLIVDSLEHWVTEYAIDGFCFLNAETLVQGGAPACLLCCSCCLCAQICKAQSSSIQSQCSRPATPA